MFCSWHVHCLNNSGLVVDAAIYKPAGHVGLLWPRMLPSIASRMTRNHETLDFKEEMKMK